MYQSTNSIRQTIDHHENISHWFSDAIHGKQDNLILCTAICNVELYRILIKKRSHC